MNDVCGPDVVGAVASSVLRASGRTGEIVAQVDEGFAKALREGGRANEHGYELGAGEGGIEGL